MNDNIENLKKMEKQTRVLSMNEYTLANFKNKRLWRDTILLTCKNWNNISCCNQEFNQLLNSYYNSYRINLPIFQEWKQYYNCLLEELSKLLNEFPMEQDAFNLSFLISNYMIPLGYLSATNSFKRVFIDEKSDFVFADYYSLDGSHIVRGKGCCRHINGFIHDLLNKMGIESYKIAGTFFPNESSYSLHKLYQEPPNHLWIAYVTDQQLFYMDPFNLEYSLAPFSQYYTSERKQLYIPDLAKSGQLYKPFSKVYSSVSVMSCEKVIQRKYELKNMMEKREIYQMIRDWKNHCTDLLTNLAFLVNTESERTIEKEHQKKFC